MPYVLSHISISPTFETPLAHAVYLDSSNNWSWLQAIFQNNLKHHEFMYKEVGGWKEKWGGGGGLHYALWNELSKLQGRDVATGPIPQYWKRCSCILANSKMDFVDMANFTKPNHTIMQ